MRRYVLSVESRIYTTPILRDYTIPCKALHNSCDTGRCCVSPVHWAYILEKTMPRKGQKGIWSQPGIPELYEEPKKRFNIALTPTAKSALDKRATELGISTSELIERFARGVIGLPHQEAATKKQRRSRKSASSG